MVRTWWLGPLVLTLTGGSAVLAQGPTERATSVAVRERLMTITEQGKTPRRCRIIQTGTLPDGSRVYLVSAIDDGHRITVVQAPRKPDGSVSSTKFYHWSSEGKPPSAIASLVVQDDRPAENLALAETKPNETFSRTTQKLEVLPPLAVAKPRELKLPDLAPAPTLAPVKVEPSVVAIGSSSVVENNAEKGPLAKGKAADAGTKGKAADAGTKGKAADAGTKGKAADAGTKGDGAGTKGAKASDAGTKGKAVDAGTKGKAADAGTKGKGDDCAPGFLERLKGSLAGLKLGKHFDSTKAAKADDAGTKGAKAGDASTKGKAADAGTKGAKGADAGTKGKGDDAGTKGKAADAGTKGTGDDCAPGFLERLKGSLSGFHLGKHSDDTKGKAADAGTKGAKAADAGTKGKAADAGTKGKAADAGTKGAKAADAGTKGAKGADAGTKGKAADAGTKGDKADSTALPHSRVAEGDPLKSPMEFQKPTKEKAEAGASLMDKLRKNLGLKDSTTSHAAEGSNKERGSNRDRQPGGRSMEAAGIAGQFGVGEGFPIMLGGQPANPPRFQDLPKPPYAPNLPGPDSNPYVASPDRGVSPGMSNAFTATSSTRPIPADFGNLPVKQNAFGPPSVPGPAPVAQVNLPLPGRNFLPPNALGMPHQATPLQALPGNAPAVLNLGKKKSKVDDDGVSNAFTDAPQLVGQPTQPTPLAPATLVTTAASSAKVNLDQPIRQLRESLLPSERELAIEAMAETDLRQQNEAASALLTAAFRDPAVTVRLCAIRTLALKLGHNPQILGALRTLKEDGDARIRAEAESALNQTGTSLPTPPSMPRPAAPRAFPMGS